MTKGEFTPVSTNEGEKPKKGSNLIRIIIIVAIVVIGIVVLALVIGLVAHFMMNSSSSTSESGMSYEPQMNGRLIRFSQGIPEEYKNYTDALTEYLDKYESDDQRGEFKMDCSSGVPPDLVDNKRSCRFDVSLLGHECIPTETYGFDEGRPCVLLALDKIKDWTPKVADFNKTDLEIPKEVRDRYQDGFIPISCESINPADKESMGPVTYYPSAGVPTTFFPYKGQKNYLSPLVFVQFKRPAYGVVFKVRCHAWVTNREVSVSFSMMVE